MIDNYKIITLCGSTKFKDAFIEAQKQLTLQGYIVSCKNCPNITIKEEYI